jgi:serine/threonine-protein kinase
MAPESVTTGKIGPHTDVYALGCVGYWLLSGRRVFEGKTPVDIVLHHVNDDPVPLRQLGFIDIPEALDAAILTCLAKDPKRRPESAEALDRTLGAISFDRPWTRARARESWKELLTASPTPGSPLQASSARS